MANDRKLIHNLKSIFLAFQIINGGKRVILDINEIRRHSRELCEFIFSDLERFILIAKHEV
ncbi:hypothetical protein A0H76_2285 [Hepatospora eriocheir]|uniref:Uncharacterized protein n=1 Tax=Hepatospora eriocheir TaxID=1081669 RepID=A0A1X0QFX6_9MICR|nr:hypothetical protein A0H76_2285 [Hepatospora eriocheir]